jgi:hypothetical protein
VFVLISSNDFKLVLLGPITDTGHVLKSYHNTGANSSVEGMNKEVLKI